MTVPFLISFFIGLFPGIIKYDTGNIGIHTYHIGSKKIKKDLKICVLSDLHGKDFGDDNKILYKSIVDSKPDFVIMAGDMINAKLAFEDKSALRLIRQLSYINIPVYYAMGNHESRLEWSPGKYNVTYDELVERIQKVGAVVLDNENAYLDEYNVLINGFSAGEAFYKKIKKGNMSTAYIDSKIGKRDTDSYEILIAHNPEYFDTYCNRGSDLVLSGHLHGGIMRLPFKYGAISPRFMLLPKYSGGLYKKKKTRMIVCRGLGEHTIPVRVFNTAELLLINIERK